MDISIRIDLDCKLLELPSLRVLLSIEQMAVGRSTDKSSSARLLVYPILNYTHSITDLKYPLIEYIV